MCVHEVKNPFPFPAIPEGSILTVPSEPVVFGPLTIEPKTDSITSIMIGDKRLPRGIRNNNPGNIERTSVRWKGMAAEQLDERFITFVAPQWGIRAIARILLGDWREGQDTIASLIEEWAPPIENNTVAYVKAVGKACGVDPWQPCDVPALLPKIIPAIIQHENGMQPYSAAVIQLGIDLERSA